MMLSSSRKWLNENNGWYVYTLIILGLGLYTCNKMKTIVRQKVRQKDLMNFLPHDSFCIGLSIVRKVRKGGKEFITGNFYYMLLLFS
jgi:hypothetical protein